MRRLLSLGGYLLIPLPRVDWPGDRGAVGGTVDGSGFGSVLQKRQLGGDSTSSGGGAFTSASVPPVGGGDLGPLDCPAGDQEGTILEVELLPIVPEKQVTAPCGERSKESSQVISLPTTTQTKLDNT